jgi:hypothetical protein
LAFFASDTVRAGTTDETVEAEVGACAEGGELSGIEAGAKGVVARVVESAMDEFRRVGTAALFRGVVGAWSQKVGASERSHRGGRANGGEERWRDGEEVVGLEGAFDKKDGFARAEIMDRVVEKVLSSCAAGASEEARADEGHRSVGAVVG